jgi:EamA domain-containing membrane protein RarD
MAIAVLPLVAAGAVVLVAVFLDDATTPLPVGGITSYLEPVILLVVGVAVGWLAGCSFWWRSAFFLLYIMFSEKKIFKLEC